MEANTQVVEERTRIAEHRPSNERPLAEPGRTELLIICRGAPMSPEEWVRDYGPDNWDTVK